MNIAIIEYEQNIDDALELFPNNTLYLSVSADASHHLSKRNINFLTDEEVLTPGEFKRIGNENFEITEKWIQELEKKLQSKASIFKKKQFYPFKWHFISLKYLVDAVRIRRVLLERLIEKENPQLLMSPIGALPELIHDHELRFHRYDSLYGLLTQKIAEQNKIKIRTWNKVESDPVETHFYDRLRPDLYKLKGGLRILLKSWLRDPTQAKDDILFGNLAYDIFPLSQELSDKYGLYFFDGPVSIRSIRTSAKLKSNSKGSVFPEFQMQGLFQAGEITGDSIVDEILGNRIQAYAEQFIPTLWKGLNYLTNIDQKKNFKAFIHIVGANNSFYGLPVYYFMKKKKPVISIQHGGSYGYALSRKQEYRDFGHNGYFLSWGDGVNEMYVKRKKRGCKIIATGSYLTEQILERRKIRKTIKKICYVPVYFSNYVASYPNEQPSLDSKWYLTTTNFLSTLKPYLDRYQIVYKIAPIAFQRPAYLGKTPMLDWVKENLPTVRIENRPLKSVIHKFDLFIIDWPSTSLVESVASGAEVLVYNGNPYHVITDSALKLLKKRAVVGSNEEDFMDKIRSVLDKGVVVSDIQDTSFLEKYGVHLNDNNSLTRMIDFIQSIC